MKKWWYGIEGIEFVWHGKWSDPGLCIDGTEVDVYDVEDYFIEEYREETGDDTDNEEHFAAWMKQNADEVLEFAREVATEKAERDERERREKCLEELDKRGFTVDGNKIIVHPDFEWDGIKEAEIPVWDFDKVEDILWKYGYEDEYEIVGGMQYETYVSNRTKQR